MTYTVPDGWKLIGVGAESVSQKARATGSGNGPPYMGVVKGDPAISVVFDRRSVLLLYPLLRVDARRPSRRDR